MIKICILVVGHDDSEHRAILKALKDHKIIENNGQVRRVGPEKSYARIAQDGLIPGIICVIYNQIKARMVDQYFTSLKVANKSEKMLPVCVSYKTKENTMPIPKGVISVNSTECIAIHLKQITEQLPVLEKNEQKVA